MKTLACAFTFCALALRLVAAVEAPPPADVPEAPAVITPALEVKNKSSFVMDESGRNPFWPIGWKPAPKTVTTTGEHVGPEISPTAFSVTSITMGQGDRYAIINGKVMNEGQIFGLQIGTQTFQITVKAIQDGQVILQRRDQEIPVPLRRR
jgi:hypothetical protein